MGKITLTNIAEELSAKSELNKETTEVFVKALIDTIEKGLYNDKVVKVKGLGTFKLLEVSDRSSVDVNTGERITIKGYNKVSFTPDSAMKEFVNRPFSHFEPTELKEGYPEEEFIEGGVLSEGSEDEEELEVMEEFQNPVVSESVEDSVSNFEVELIPSVIETDDVIVDSEVPAVDNAKNGAEDIGTEEGVVENTVEHIGKANEVDETPVITLAVGQSTPSGKPKRHRVGMVFILLVFFGLAAGAIRYFMPEDIAVETAGDDIVVNPNLQEELGEEWKNIPEMNVATEREESTIDNTEQKDKGFVAVATPKEGVVEISAETSNNLKELKDITLADTTDYTIVGTQVVHTLRNGETIISLSNKYYGDKRLWPYIVKHNNIKEFNKVSIGMKVAIPILKEKTVE